MTRKSAIRMIVGSLSGLFVEVAKAQNGMTIGTLSLGSLASVSFGDAIEKSEAEKQSARLSYKLCLAEAKAMPVTAMFCADPDHSFLMSQQQLKPGTARMTINLDGWKEFEVNMGGKTVRISRQEIWEALQ